MRAVDDRLRGLYGVTSEALCRDPAALEIGVRAAIVGGARLIQYRDKWNPPDIRLARAQTLRRLCSDGGALFIVNDDAVLAAAADADGVHLGRTDGAVAAARRALGADAVIGVSCAGSLEYALAAEADGASYVAFGRFFASRTKPQAPATEIAVLAHARQSLRLPICAIGGVTPANAASLIAAGADMVAAVDALFGAVDIGGTARQFSALFGVPPLQSGAPRR